MLDNSVEDPVAEGWSVSSSYWNVVGDAVRERQTNAQRCCGLHIGRAKH